MLGEGINTLKLECLTPQKPFSDPPSTARIRSGVVEKAGLYHLLNTGPGHNEHDVGCFDASRLCKPSNSWDSYCA